MTVHTLKVGAQLKTFVRYAEVEAIHEVGQDRADHHAVGCIDHAIIVLIFIEEVTGNKTALCYKLTGVSAIVDLSLILKYAVDLVAEEGVDRFAYNRSLAKLG